jgi:hypothetical protein
MATAVTADCTAIRPILVEFVAEHSLVDAEMSDVELPTLGVVAFGGATQLLVQFAYQSVEVFACGSHLR